MQKKIAALAAICLVLAACSSNDKKEPLKGERISVMQATSALQADQEALGTPADFPEAVTNTAWPQAGGNAQHAPQHIKLGPNLKKVWGVSIGDGSGDETKLITAPVIADGKIFAANTEGEVMALNPKDGKEIWNVDILPRGESSPTVSSGLAYGEGRLYVTDGVGYVLALNPADGKRLWTKKVDRPVRSSPTIQDGRVYVTTMEDETIALNASNGEIVWRYKGIQEGAGLLGAPSPAVEGSVVIAGYSSGDIVALRAETGQEAWSDSLTGISEFQSRSVTTLSGFRGQPVLENDNVIVGNLSSKLVSVHVPSGDRVWQKEFGVPQTPWIAGNSVFVLTVQNELISLLKETGQIRWVITLPRFEDPTDKEDPIFWNGPVLAGGRLILAGSNEKLLEIDPQNGKTLRETELSDKVMLPPVVANKTLYILSDNGNLVAYQ